MDTVVMEVNVGEDRRLVIDLPLTMPTGRAEVIVRAVGEGNVTTRELSRRNVQSKLRAAGILNTMHTAPHDAAPLTEEDRKRIGNLFDAGKAVTADDNERGEY
jgi:hypothetical protein